jgi:7-cyano-7-deazaguanine reductase
MKSQDDFSHLTILKKGKTDYTGGSGQALLETFPNKYKNRDYVIVFQCPEFTSLCPITGQPDFAQITITYVPDQVCLESKSLKLYLFSFRNTGMFHEEITNRILDDVVAATQPRWCRIRALMNPRGGISIEVIAEYCQCGFTPSDIPKQ